jgi:hypothetical protein
MFIEQNYSPGHIINLDHVASMNWDKGLSVEFVMANGQTIIWEYESEDDQMEDLNVVSKMLHEADMFISAAKDQE